MIVLVDMDGTIADWGHGWDRALDAQGSRARAIRRHAQQESFDLKEGLGPRQSLVVDRVMNLHGFYANLLPIPGAIDALREMARDYAVKICTSPWLTNPTCIPDKIDWVARHLGDSWVDRMVFSKDKTIVKGDFLIDDKPEIKGDATPEWEHIIYTQPYNITQPQRRIDDWSKWSEVIK